MNTPLPGPAAPPKAGTHRTRVLIVISLAAALVAGLIGVAIGGLGGFALSSSGIGGAGSSRAEQSAAEGCATLARVDDELPLTDESLNLSEPLVFELMGAAGLFMATGRADDSFVEFADAGQDLISGTNTLDMETANESIEILTRECAAL